MPGIPDNLPSMKIKKYGQLGCLSPVSSFNPVIHRLAIWLGSSSVFLYTSAGAFSLWGLAFCIQLLLNIPAGESTCRLLGLWGFQPPRAGLPMGPVFSWENFPPRPGLPLLCTALFSLLAPAWSAGSISPVLQHLLLQLFLWLPGKVSSTTPGRDRVLAGVFLLPHPLCHRYLFILVPALSFSFSPSPGFICIDVFIQNYHIPLSVFILQVSIPTWLFY